jgi:hypothetical protein
MLRTSRSKTCEEFAAIINKQPILVYLASPYSKFPAGLDTAHREVCIIAGKLFYLGVNVFCPIAHNHEIVKLVKMPVDFDRWKSYNELMLKRSDILAIAMLDTWDESEGVEGEMDKANAMSMPTYFIRP